MPNGALPADEFAHLVKLEIPAKIRELGARVFLDAVTQADEFITQETPVDTGYLRASKSAVLDGDPVPVLPPKPGNAAGIGEHRGARAAASPHFQAQMAQAAEQSAGAIGRAAAEMQPITIGFTAEYAPYVEDDVHMVAQAAFQWPRFVENALANAVGTAGASRITRAQAKRERRRSRNLGVGA